MVIRSSCLVWSDMTVTPDNLNDLAEFDRVFMVHNDGTVSFPDGIYAPGVVHEDTERNRADIGDKDFQAVTGWSDQYTYSGPVMHPSEFLGGRMAEWVLETPGIYAVVVVDVLSCEDCEDLEPDHEPDCEHEPSGWMLLTGKAELELARESEIYKIGVSNDG